MLEFIWDEIKMCHFNGRVHIQNYTFFFQSGDQCFCGNSYGKHGSRPESECNDPCPGDSLEKCGGHWRLSIYLTG